MQWNMRRLGIKSLQGSVKVAISRGEIQIHDHHLKRTIIRLLN